MSEKDTTPSGVQEPQANAWPWYRKLPAIVIVVAVVESVLCCFLLYPRIGFSFRAMQSNPPMSVIAFSLVLLFFTLLFSVYVAEGNPLLRKKYAICLVGVVAVMTIVFTLNIFFRYFA